MYIWVLDFLSFCRNRTDDLGINSPALWPTELVLYRPGCPAPSPALPVRGCAESCNSSLQMCTTIDAIDVTVTAKAIFERLYWVPGRGTFGLSVNCPCAWTSSTAQSRLIFDFPAFLSKNFTLVAPDFFGQHDSRSNLTGSRYPQQSSLFCRILFPPDPIKHLCSVTVFFKKQFHYL